MFRELNLKEQRAAWRVDRATATRRVWHEERKSSLRTGEKTQGPRRVQGLQQKRISRTKAEGAEEKRKSERLCLHCHELKKKGTTGVQAIDEN